MRGVRLACVKHAASVRSEPGSNSQVHLRPVPSSPNPLTETKTTREPTLNEQSPCSSRSALAHEFTRSVCQRIKSQHRQTSSSIQITMVPSETMPNQMPTPSHSHAQVKDAANVSLPIPDLLVNEHPVSGSGASRLGVGRRFLVGGVRRVNEIRSPFSHSRRRPEKPRNSEASTNASDRIWGVRPAGGSPLGQGCGIRMARPAHVRPPCTPP